MTTSTAKTRIISYEESMREELINFSKIVHPQIENIEAHLDWFAYGNPFKGSNNGLAGLWSLTEEGNIIGEYLLNKVQWHLNQKSYDGFFGYDYFVKENYRDKGVGGWLLIGVLKKYQPFFGVGLTKNVIPIYEKAKVPTIGYYKKHVWFNKFLPSIGNFLKYSFKGEKRILEHQKSYPDILYSSHKEFRLLKSITSEMYQPYYDDDIVEFSRSLDFLQWRFFESNKEYFFYLCRDEKYPLYFVVREVIYKGLYLLLVVDMKFPFNDLDSGSIILEGLQQLAKKLDTDGVIMISSNKKLDKLLRKYEFSDVGNPSPIVSNVFKQMNNLQGENPPIHITMADSDLDLNFGDQ